MCPEASSYIERQAVAVSGEANKHHFCGSLSDYMPSIPAPWSNALPLTTIKTTQPFAWNTDRAASTSQISYLYIALSSITIHRLPRPQNSRSSLPSRKPNKLVQQSYSHPNNQKRKRHIITPNISIRSYAACCCRSSAQNMPFDATGPPLYSGRRSARSGAMSGCHWARKVIATRKKHQVVSKPHIPCPNLVGDGGSSSSTYPT